MRINPSVKQAAGYLPMIASVVMMFSGGSNWKFDPLKPNAFQLCGVCMAIAWFWTRNPISKIEKVSIPIFVLFWVLIRRMMSEGAFSSREDYLAGILLAITAVLASSIQWLFFKPQRRFTLIAFGLMLSVTGLALWRMDNTAMENLTWARTTLLRSYVWSIVNVVSMTSLLMLLVWFGAIKSTLQRRTSEALVVVNFAPLLYIVGHDFFRETVFDFNETFLQRFRPTSLGLVGLTIYLAPIPILLWITARSCRPVVVSPTVDAAPPRKRFGSSTLLLGRYGWLQLVIVSCWVVTLVPATVGSMETRPMIWGKGLLSQRQGWPMTYLSRSCRLDADDHFWLGEFRSTFQADTGALVINVSVMLFLVYAIGWLLPRCIGVYQRSNSTGLQKVTFVRWCVVTGAVCLLMFLGHRSLSRQHSRVNAENLIVASMDQPAVDRVISQRLPLWLNPFDLTVAAIHNLFMSRNLPQRPEVTVDLTLPAMADSPVPLSALEWLHDIEVSAGEINSEQLETFNRLPIRSLRFLPAVSLPEGLKVLSRRSGRLQRLECHDRAIDYRNFVQSQPNLLHLSLTTDAKNIDWLPIDIVSVDIRLLSDDSSIDAQRRDLQELRITGNGDDLTLRLLDTVYQNSTRVDNFRQLQIDWTRNPQDGVSVQTELIAIPSLPASVEFEVLTSFFGDERPHLKFTLRNARVQRFDRLEREIMASLTFSRSESAEDVANSLDALKATQLASIYISGADVSKDVIDGLRGITNCHDVSILPHPEASVQPVISDLQVLTQFGSVYMPQVVVTEQSLHELLATDSDLESFTADGRRIRSLDLTRCKRKMTLGLANCPGLESFFPSAERIQLVLGDPGFDSLQHAVWNEGWHVRGRAFTAARLNEIFGDLHPYGLRWSAPDTSQIPDADLSKMRWLILDNPDMSFETIMSLQFDWEPLDLSAYPEVPEEFRLVLSNLFQGLSIALPESLTPRQLTYFLQRLKPVALLHLRTPSQPVVDAGLDHDLLAILNESRFPDDLTISFRNRLITEKFAVALLNYQPDDPKVLDLRGCRITESALNLLLESPAVSRIQLDDSKIQPTSSEADQS